MQERRVAPLFAGWIAFVLGGLTVLTVGSYFTDRADASQVGPTPALEIEVTANQWWCEVEYRHSTASNTFRTANELHLPVGVAAHITLKSNDVIHSFWVPNLAGKQALIPGRQTDVVLKPTRTGVYCGQCGEYCGMQHAHMALDVKVESRANFARWWGEPTGAGCAAHRPASHAGRGSVSRAAVQHLPLDRGHRRRRYPGAGPHPCGEPHVSRRRHDADDARAPLWLGGRSAIAQNGQPDAPRASQLRRAACRGRLS